eukprot:g18860.t1
MFDDVISTGLQAVLAEIFESVDKNQLNVSLVGDIFKESHLELTDLRLKKTLLKDMNLSVEVKEGLVGKLVIQGLSGVMTGDPVTISVGEVLLLLTPGSTLSDPEAGLAARRMAAALREMFANRYAEDFLEDALGVKLEDKLSVQSQNKLNRKLLRHIVRKVLSGVTIVMQTVHVRFELPAGGLDGAEPVKASMGVGGGGACDAVGVMLPSLTVRSCNTDHPSFAKFSAQTPLDRVTNPKTAASSSKDPPQRESAATMARREQEAKQGDRKNFMIVRKRATASNLQVYCDYGVDSYVTAIGAAVSAARNKATNPRPGTSGSLPGGTLTPAASANGAAAAAKAVRALFLQKWKSERHALLFKPLAVEVGAEVHQWDQPGGQAIAPIYRVARVNVGVGELQAVVDSEQGRVVGAVIDEIVNLIRRAKFNRFVPQAYLPLSNLPPPKVRPPKPAKNGAPAGMLPSVETWSWASERGSTPGMVKPKSAAEAILQGGFAKEGGAWARAMWRFAGACVRHDVRSALTKKLPSSLPNWDGTLATPPTSAPSVPPPPVDTAAPGATNGVPGVVDPAETSSWRVTYLRLHARTLAARDAKSLSSNGSHRGIDVRRLGVPKGREPLSLEEMWEMAKVESYAPGDEVVFLRTAAKVSSHYEWSRARRARAAAKSAASQKGASPEAVAAAAGAAAAAAVWTPKDDLTVLCNLDELRAKRAAAAAAKAAGVGGARAGAEAAVAEEEEEDDVDISKLEFAATVAAGFSDDDDDSDSETDEDSEDDDDDDSEDGGARGNASPASGGSKFSLADIAAKAKQTLAPGGSTAATAAQKGVMSPAQKGPGGGSLAGGGKAAKLWGKLLGLPRFVVQVESAGIELRTRIASGARRPLVALSAGALTATLEGDEARRVLWWEVKLGNVTLRDLCSSWGDERSGAKKGAPAAAAAAAPVAKTLMSGSASGVEGREWVSGGDPSGAAERSFLVVRVVHDPNRAACGLFTTSAAAMAQLRTHVVVGSVTGKIPPQVLAVFNAAARDIVVNERRAGTSSARPRVSTPNDTAARQLRVVLGSVYRALSGDRSVAFRPKKRKGPSAAVRALSMARGVTSSSSSSGEVDSKELYRVVAGILPGDFEVRVHTSEVIVQVASRAKDLLEAGKVALEAVGETKAAADMQGGAAAADSIDLEIDLAPVKVDTCRSSKPSPEFWIDTGILRTKLRAPDKAVEAVVTALLTSAQRTTAAVALLSGSAPPGEDDEEEDMAA